MFQRKLEMYLKRHSRRYYTHTSGWVEIFCPFCGDATRKNNPSHGHLYIQSDVNFFNCFRCTEGGSIVRLLLEFNIHDPDVFHWLSSKRRSDIGYSKIATSVTGGLLNKVRVDTLLSYNDTPTSDMLKFREYMICRCSLIDFSKFLVRPSNSKGIIGCSFYNASNQFVTTRFISGSRRYELSNIKPFYYFQELRSMVDYTDIVICEGVFDAVNMASYYPKFKDAFFIAINGNQYLAALNRIVNSFLLIGIYTIHVVLDNGLKSENRLKYNLVKTAFDLNKTTGVVLYKSIHGKDSSEMMLLEVQ